MGDRILIKFDIYEGIHVSELLFQIPTRSVNIGGSWEEGNRKSCKTLRVEESG